MGGLAENLRGGRVAAFVHAPRPGTTEAGPEVHQ